MTYSVVKCNDSIYRVCLTRSQFAGMVVAIYDDKSKATSHVDYLNKNTNHHNYFDKNQT